MRARRIPYPEFQTYAKQMERAKRIIEKVVSEPIPSDHEDVGAQAQKIRRVLEVIVNACLVIHLEIGGEEKLQRFKNKSRAEVLKDKLGIDCYPSVPELAIENPTAAVISPSVPRGEYLTRDRWFTVWNECGGYIHEDRPGSTKPKPNYEDYAHKSRVWLQWMVNLLTFHTISTRDLKQYAEVSLHGKEGRVVLVARERITPWQTKIDGVGRVRKRVDGAWVDAVDADAKEFAISVQRKVGIYTARTFTPIPMNSRYSV